jgi:non-reducing end alpha-L-arabinofuranosidase
LLIVAAALALAGTGVLTAAGGAQAAGSGPCDIYAAGGTSCVAAYSTVRALYSAYNGPLYQVRRVSDGATANVGLLAAGGYANATEQDTFCAHTACVITELFDQSSEGNNLTIEGAGGAAGADVGANAAALPVTAGGHKVYGLYIAGHTGYRDNSTRGVAVNGAAEGMYMVASGTHVNSGCCFDFGNAEANSDDNGNGHMDAVNLGTECYFAPCSGTGPWVEAPQARSRRPAASAWT